uniref:Uncharacterized protein n=1 Tax=Glossina palpalis gambiensis TaxID=67801 RepID=A0A1B0C5Y8_9MUSC
MLKHGENVVNFTVGMLRMKGVSRSGSENYQKKLKRTGEVHQAPTFTQLNRKEESHKTHGSDFIVGKETSYAFILKIINRKIIFEVPVEC